METILFGLGLCLPAVAFFWRFRGAQDSPTPWSRLVEWAALGVIAGGALGGWEAWIYRANSKRVVFENSLSNLGLHIAFGTAFYSQVFLVFMVVAGLFFLFVWPWTKRDLEDRTKSASLPLAVVLVGIAALHVAYGVNAWAPGLASVPSMVGNLALLLASVLLIFPVAFLVRKLLGLVPSFILSKPVVLLIPALVFQVAAVIALAGFGLEARLSVRDDAGKKAAGPNILLITVDTLRADHLSIHGYKRIATPNMDRLASQGALFERAIAPSSWTLPSLVSIQTGNDPRVHGQIANDSVLDGGFVTVAEVLKEKGYLTAAFLTNTYVLAKKGLNQGFDVYHHAENNENAPSLLGLSLYRFLLPIRAEPQSAQEVTRRALRFLKRYRDRSFYMWIHYIDPHVPYGAWYVKHHPEYDRDYQGSYGRVISIEQLMSLSVSRKIPSDRDIRHWNACYDAEILYLDQSIGRLLDGLENLGLAENTIVVLTSDHGEEFWEHDYLCHGHTLYREVVHVPLIVRWPGQVTSGLRIPSTVSLLDIAPTLFDVSGIAAPDGYQGRSLMQALKGKALGMAPVHSHLDLEQRQKRSVHTDGEDLIQDRNAKTFELYDPVDDFAQRVNLSERFPDTVMGLADRMDRWQQEADRLKETLPVRNTPGKIEVDSQMAEQLRALGYIQ